VGRLEEELVGHILNTSSSYKRDVMEQTIRDLLGASKLAKVTGLPARRGGADGGIDGIIDITHICQGVATPKQAALNVKIRDSDFTREQLGGFLLDMDREKITVGIILTARNLSPDATCELNRKNIEGMVYLVHIKLSDILSGAINSAGIFIKGDSLNEVLISKVKLLLLNAS
jgi:hypothetical protein